MTTSHPDVFWHRGNWVPHDVSRVVRARIRWAAPDLVALLEEIDEAGIERGTFGQTVFHVLTLDQSLEPKLLRAALDRALPDAPRFWAAAILLYLAGDDAAATLERLFYADETLHGEGLCPPSRAFQEVAHVDDLAAAVAQFGYVSLF